MDRTFLSNLRDLLAGLFFTPQDIRRVLEDAGVDVRRIAFDAKSINTWHSALDFAAKNNRVDAIVTAARADFPDHELLKQAAEGVLRERPWSRRGSEPDWHTTSDDGTDEKLTGDSSTLLPITFLQLGLLRAQSVVRVALSTGETGTGFLVGPRPWLLTSHHVIRDPADASGAVAQFNEQEVLRGDPLTETVALAPGSGFATSREFDWTAVRLATSPASEWTPAPLAAVPAKKGDRVVIIQHPGGGPKRVALHHNKVAYADSEQVQYLTDTLQGSSGSPVFNAAWEVVGMHRRGGWIHDPQSKEAVWRNAGVPIGRILSGLRAAGVDLS